MSKPSTNNPNPAIALLLSLFLLASVRPSEAVVPLVLTPQIVSGVSLGITLYGAWKANQTMNELGVFRENNPPAFDGSDNGIFDSLGIGRNTVDTTLERDEKRDNGARLHIWGERPDIGLVEYGGVKQTSSLAECEELITVIETQLQDLSDLNFTQIGYYSLLELVAPGVDKHNLHGDGMEAPRKIFFQNPGPEHYVYTSFATGHKFFQELTVLPAIFKGTGTYTPETNTIIDFNLSITELECVPKN